MGWTYTHRPRGMTDLDFFKREWPTMGPKIVASASKNGVFYGVLETDAETEPALVPDANGKIRVALVVFTRRAPKSEYNFGYKEMDEFCGPYAWECPARLLAMLSPIRPEACFIAGKGRHSYSGLRSASEWRAGCRANAAKQSNRLKLRPGMKVKLPKPITFNNGAELDTFMVEKHPNRRGFVFANGYTRYRLRREDQLNLVPA